PGVPSVGPKTAKELLTSYGSIDGIYEHLDEIKRKKLKETLEENRVQAKLSQQLVTLKDDCDLKLDLSALGLQQRDTARLTTLYRELGFTRQLQALELEAFEKKPRAPARPAPTMAETSVSLANSLNAIRALVAAARKSGRIALEAHTPTPSEHRTLVGLALSAVPGSGAYVPLGHRYLGAPPQVELAALRELLAPVFADASIVKGGHDLKRTRVLLEHAGFRDFAGFDGDT